METNGIEIEVCTNVEWWREFGPLGDCDDDAIEAVIDDVMRAIDDAGFESVRARGQRRSCHGWNGDCALRRKEWGIGTFAKIDDDQWRLVTDAAFPVIDAARSAAAS